MHYCDYGKRFVEEWFAGRKRQYADFLRSPEWRAAAARVRERFNNLCVVCRCSENLEVNHSSYYYPNRSEAPVTLPRGWLPVADAGLVLMCSDCHRAFHRLWRL